MDTRVVRVILTLERGALTIPEAKSRRAFTAQQKADIVRRHLSGKEPVSDLAEELKIQPSQLHQWTQIVLAQAEQAFDRATRGPARDKAAT